MPPLPQPRYIWHCLEIILVVTTEGYYWNLMGRDTHRNLLNILQCTECLKHQRIIWIQMKTVLRLNNPDLMIGISGSHEAESYVCEGVCLCEWDSKTGGRQFVYIQFDLVWSCSKDSPCFCSLALKEQESLSFHFVPLPSNT